MKILEKAIKEVFRELDRVADPLRRLNIAIAYGKLLRAKEYLKSQGE